MTRFIAHGRSFLPVDPIWQYENSFESLLVSYADVLFPEFHVARLKITLESHYGDVEPDLVMIRKDFRGWWLCEVETIDHSLHGHVLPQIMRLVNSAVPDDMAEKIAKRLPALDPARIGRLTRSDSPSFALIVNALRQEWLDHLAKYPIRTILVEVYRDHLESPAFRQANEIPSMHERELSEVEIVRGVSGAIRLVKPAAISARDGQILHISFNQFITRWKFVDVSQQECWLVPEGKSPLDGRKTYLICSDDSGNLQFEEK